MRAILKPPIKKSATMAINTKVSELRASGRPVYHLGFGEARFPVHPKILTAFHEHATARSYLPVAGLPELRARVADFYRQKFEFDVDARRVMVGCGSKTMLFAAMYSLEGDVLLPSPTWVSYDAQAVFAGKGITWIPTRLENNYCLTADGLKAGISAAKNAGQAPGILVLTSPGNPSSSVYSPGLLAELAEVARQAELVVISDEIYALTTYSDVPYVSFAKYYPEGTVVTGGLSKHLSLGGWRLGVALMPPGNFGTDLFSYMRAIAGNVWTTAPAPIQYAATVAYSNDPDVNAYAETCTAVHGELTRYLYRALHALGVPTSKPEGGFYVYPSFAPWRKALAQRHNVRTSQDLSNFLLDEMQIASLPGSVFGADPQELTLRLSTSYLYGFTDEEGEAVLASYRKNLPTEQFIKEACPDVIEAGERFKQLINALNA